MGDIQDIEDEFNAPCTSIFCMPMFNNIALHDYQYQFAHGSNMTQEVKPPDEQRVQVSKRVQFAAKLLEAASRPAPDVEAAMPAECDLLGDTETVAEQEADFASDSASMESCQESGQLPKQQTCEFDAGPIASWQAAVLACAPRSQKVPEARLPDIQTDLRVWCNQILASNATASRTRERVQDWTAVEAAPRRLDSLRQQASTMTPFLRELRENSNQAAGEHNAQRLPEPSKRKRHVLRGHLGRIHEPSSIYVPQQDSRRVMKVSSLPALPSRKSATSEVRSLVHAMPQRFMLVR